MPVPDRSAFPSAALVKIYKMLPPLNSKTYIRWTIGLAGRLTLLMALQANVVTSGLFTAAAYGNYPGGRALLHVHMAGGTSARGGAARTTHRHTGAPRDRSNFKLGVSNFKLL